MIKLEVTKSGSRREVPISAAGDRVLARRREAAVGAHVFPNHGWDSFRTAYERAVDAAGLDSDVTFHTLRHTFAS